MKVLKFGGSSVATPARIAQRVCPIVVAAREHDPVVVVVSAFGGVTNDLIAAIDLAADRNPRYQDIWSALRTRHRDAVGALADPSEHDDLLREVDERLADLRDLLHGVELLREASPRSRDGILSYGERLSAGLTAAALRARGESSQALDTRRVIRTDDHFGCARVDLESSLPRLREAIEASPGIAVATGFIAATEGGQTTTLGRGGSDYTAALLGAALDASAIELWTDVDGVMSADPRQVEDTRPIPLLGYAELMELSHFGARVVYPPTIHPARSRGIPLVIRNTLSPEAPGTRVEASTPPSTGPIRGVSSIPHVALLRLEGDGMVGIPGIARRLFDALARDDVSVILISQASSEHSICFAVAPEDADTARRAVAQEFTLEQRLGTIDDLVVETDLSIVAVVGEALRERAGIAARIFSVLGNHGVNVRAIAQGSSERNISLAIARHDESRALQAIHGAFFGRPQRIVRIAVAGVGRVGGVLLEQLAAQAGDLRRGHDLDLRVVAVANSRRLLHDTTGEGIPLTSWPAQLDAAPAFDAGALEGVLTAPGAPSVFVDCTASEAVVGLYPALLSAGVAVVAANKRAFAGPWDRLDAFRTAARDRHTPLLFETTVGAGLPVVRPLQDLVRTGDRILRIEGVLSGTLNAVLDLVDGGTSLDLAVRQAHDQGLTEPHPWDDLSGEDVARKLCILARIAGRSVELDRIDVTPLCPHPGDGAHDLDRFWPAVADASEAMETRRAEAAHAGRRLRYVATLDDEGARVGVEAVDAEHPAYALTGPNNLVAVTSERYREDPLVVRGPGAGPAVTAAGVFADVLAAAAVVLGRD